MSNKFFRKFAEDETWHGNKCVARIIYDEVDTIDLPSNGQLPLNFTGLLRLLIIVYCILVDMDFIHQHIVLIVIQLEIELIMLVSQEKQ